MPTFTRFALTFLSFGFFETLFSQNVAIFYQNPENLFVCGNDSFVVTLQNASANATTGLLATLTLPAGIRYEPGSVAGATESDISNLSTPKFTVADLPAGGSQVFSLKIKADCDLIDVINSGGQFANTISVAYAGGVQQLTTDFFKVETGLVFITSVAPMTQTGVSGSVLNRTVSVRNTRQGAIAALQFSDQHAGGLNINLAGVGGQNSAFQFEATVPGSYFTGFGDGDNLFEYNEIVTLTEEITLLDCGNIPPTSKPSAIRVGWGCDGSVCQLDSAQAEVKIQPANNSVNLAFFPTYGAPTSNCGNEATKQEFIVVNLGNEPATDLKITIYSDDSTRLGLDDASFELNTGSGWAPLIADFGSPTTLESCNLDDFKKYVAIILPDLPPGDTLRVRFDTYFCQEICFTENVGLTGIVSYKKSCPPGQPASANFTISPDVSALEIKSKIYFDIGVCLENDALYNFSYWVQSKQLLNFTGFLQLQLELPWGLFWENTCVPTLDGQSPISIKVDSVPNQMSILNLTFQLPMSSDSVFGDFCLRNICQPVSFYEPAIAPLPESGTDFTVYPVDNSCEPCLQKVRAVTFLSTSADADAECGISVCDTYELVLNCGCNDPSCVGGGDGALLVADFDSWRTNVGFQDNDDNRSADNFSPAKSPMIRLDRFLPGDTMRTLLRGVMLSGDASAVRFRLFNESWQSDFGLDGGDAYEIPSAKDIFTNAELLRYLNGSVTLKIATTGESYTCPVGAASAISDQHYVQIAEPNIRPEVVYDQLATMFHEFTINLPALASTGCVPQGLLLQPGDSLIFTGDFHFLQNFVPEASNQPPLINFRNTVCSPRNVIAWQLNGCYPPLMRQYSGYMEQILMPAYRIEPCSTSTELSPFGYTVRIARENLFPYEVRRLAAITDFQHSLPPGIFPTETRLNFLRLQENMPVFNSQLLTPDISGSNLSLNFQPFFSNPLDEGFSMETSLKFAPDCEFVGPVLAQTTVTVNYFSNGFRLPSPFTAMSSNPFGYINSKPNLDLVVQNSVLDIPGDALELDFFLNNYGFLVSPNTWISWEISGDLTGAELLLMPQQQALSAVGNVFQLGDLPANEVFSLRLKGKLKTCEPVFLTLHYGWDCAPVTSPDGNYCGTFEKTVELRPLFPELELVVVAQPEDLPMCAPSDFFEFEIYNANEGIAFGTLGSVKLPSGLSIVPGSSRLSYPVGSPYVNLPDPFALPGNVYQWTPEAVSATLAQNGLQSIDKEPENALRIRFRVQAECGFVANTRPIYGAEAVLSCGAASNVLRKPGEPVQLEGFGPSYDISASLAYATLQDGTDCGQIATLTATLVLDGTPKSGDSIYVLLPAGVSYVSGSYQPGQNAPLASPQVFGNVLQLPFPANLPDNALLQFSFSVRYDDPAACVDKAVQLQARERLSVFCPLTNQNCAAYIATGEAVLFLEVKNPDLILQNFQTALNNNQLSFSGNLLNEGNGAANNPVVQFYLDQNGNGQVDANEPLVTTLSSGSTLTPGSSLPLAGVLDLPPAVLCQLLAFIPASENCACANKTFPVNQNPVVHSAAGFCEVVPATIGVDSMAGSTYTWLTSNNLSCTNCAQTTFLPSPGIQPGDVVTLVLEEKTGNCVIEHRFEVRFGGELELQTPDQSICEGESVKLEATPGGVYQWSGPGLGNLSSPVQIVQPAQTSTYSVTITFNGGCTGTDQTQVTVFQKDSLDLGNILTCVGNPVNVFGTLTDQPGFYTQNLKNSNGCDSIVTLRLVVYPSQTFESQPICPGDSVIVFDSVFTTAGNLCRQLISSTGCDSTHCIAVEILPELVLPAVQDSFVISAGEEVQLDGPEGFDTYEWTPNEGLNCTNCPDPLASPEISTAYLLTVGDSNGCSATATYRVLLCDFDKLNIPNAFTPNGDGVNDVFRIVPTENLADIQSLIVFNRWGQKVWESSGMNAQWDGNFDGKPAPSDVYVWLLKGGCYGLTLEKKGDVALLR